MTHFYGLRLVGSSSRLNVSAARGFVNHGDMRFSLSMLAGLTKARDKGAILRRGKTGLGPEGAVRDALVESFRSGKAKKRFVLFTGGIDSLLIASLLRAQGEDVQALTVKFEDFNPRTVAYARKIALRQGISHQVIEVKLPDFLRDFERVVQMTEVPIFDLDSVLLYGALRRARRKLQDACLISGMGSDQWFGDDFYECGQGEKQGRLDATWMQRKVHEEIAAVFRVSFVFPFLSSRAISLACSLDSKFKKNKILLKSLAAEYFPVSSKSMSREIQIPPLARYLLVKIYGDRAWPASAHAKNLNACTDRILRGIVLGLWLEKYQIMAS